KTMSRSWSSGSSPIGRFLRSGRDLRGLWLNPSPCKEGLAPRTRSVDRGDPSPAYGNSKLTRLSMPFAARLLCPSARFLKGTLTRASGGREPRPSRHPARWVAARAGRRSCAMRRPERKEGRGPKLNEGLRGLVYLAFGQAF